MVKTKKEIVEFIGVGRRKRAISSVRVRKGTGKIDVNHRSFENYFTTIGQRQTALSPLEKIGAQDKYDLIIRIKGGGVEAQSVATRLGISRALVLENEDLRKEFKELGYLTRDPRKRERKKYGLAGARKRFQFSKR